MRKLIRDTVDWFLFKFDALCIGAMIGIIIAGCLIEINRAKPSKVAAVNVDTTNLVSVRWLDCPVTEAWAIEGSHYKKMATRDAEVTAILGLRSDGIVIWGTNEKWRSLK